MEQPQRKKRPNQMEKVQGLMGMAMGVVYIFVGIMLVYGNLRNVLSLGNTLTYILSPVVILYGLFRIWRGWQMRKKYLREAQQQKRF